MDTRLRNIDGGVIYGFYGSANIRSNLLVQSRTLVPPVSVRAWCPPSCRTVPWMLMESHHASKTWRDRRVKERCLRAWMLSLIRTALRDRRNLRAELGSKKGASIWQMSKAQLVEQAVQKLGWERAKAEQDTKAQLQLYLKELPTMTARGPLLPAGWKRYKTVELQRLMRERNLETEGKTNQ